MNLEINVLDYLSDEEIKDIIKDEIRSRIREFSENDIERIVCNTAYKVVWQAVDDVYDNNTQEMLRDKVVEQINEFSNFNLFRVPDAWQNTANAPYTTLCDVVKDNKELLDMKVKEGVSKLTKTDMKNVALELVKQKML